MRKLSAGNKTKAMAMSILGAGRYPVSLAVGFMWQFLTLPVALGVVLVLAGCATVPMGDSRDDSYLKSFPTKPAVAETRKRS